MGEVYFHNKQSGSEYLLGKENLPALEDDVHSDEAIVSSVIENYETAIEEDWSGFVKNFYE